MENNYNENVPTQKESAFNRSDNIKGRRRVWKCLDCGKWNPYMVFHDTHTGNSKARFVCEHCEGEAIDDKYKRKEGESRKGFFHRLFPAMIDNVFASDIELLDSISVKF